MATSLRPALVLPADMANRVVPNSERHLLHGFEGPNNTGQNIQLTCAAMLLIVWPSNSRPDQVSKRQKQTSALRTPAACRLLSLTTQLHL